MPVGEELPAAGLRPRRERLHRAARPTARGVEVVVVPDQRPPPAARALRAVGRQRLRRPADAREGQGQVHHRPHLGGRAVAQVPRPPREHLAATSSSAPSTPSPARPAGQGPARRRDQAASPTSPSTTTRPARAGWPSATRTTARARPASTPPWSPASATPRSSSPAASPASTRPTSRSRACCRSPSPTRPTYDQIGEDDRISILGLADLAPDEPVRCQHHQARRHHGRLRGASTR